MCILGVLRCLWVSALMYVCSRFPHQPLRPLRALAAMDLFSFMVENSPAQLSSAAKAVLATQSEAKPKTPRATPPKAQLLTAAEEALMTTAYETPPSHKARLSRAFLEESPATPPSQMPNDAPLPENAWREAEVAGAEYAGSPLKRPLKSEDVKDQKASPKRSDGPKDPGLDTHESYEGTGPLLKRHEPCEGAEPPLKQSKPMTEEEAPSSPKAQQCETGEDKKVCPQAETASELCPTAGNALELAAQKLESALAQVEGLKSTCDVFQEAAMLCANSTVSAQGKDGSQHSVWILAERVKRIDVDANKMWHDARICLKTRAATPGSTTKQRSSVCIPLGLEPNSDHVLLTAKSYLALLQVVGETPGLDLPEDLAVLGMVVKEWGAEKMPAN